MKKFRYMLAALAAAAIVAAVLVGCKKEKVANDDTPKGRQPIATRNYQTGEMHYSFDFEAASNSIITAMSKNNRDANNFVLESCRIIDDGENPLSLEIVVLDIEKEISISFWYMDGFIVKEVSDGITSYYLDSNLQRGNFSYALKEANKEYLMTIRDWQLFVEEFDGGAKSDRPKPKGVECHNHHCISNSCIGYEDANGNYGCTPCTKTEPDGYCDTTLISDVGINWEVILGFLGLVAGFLL